MSATEAGIRPTQTVNVQRFVNDEIARTARRLGARLSSRFEFVCECGDLSCRDVVPMALARYGASAPGSIVAH